MTNYETLDRRLFAGDTGFSYTFLEHLRSSRFIVALDRRLLGDTGFAYTFLEHLSSSQFVVGFAPPGL
jgi:hypothetical protein